MGYLGDTWVGQHATEARHEAVLARRIEAPVAHAGLLEVVLLRNDAFLPAPEDFGGRDGRLLTDAHWVKARREVVHLRIRVCQRQSVISKYRTVGIN